MYGNREDGGTTDLPSVVGTRKKGVWFSVELYFRQMEQRMSEYMDKLNDEIDAALANLPTPGPDESLFPPFSIECRGEQVCGCAPGDHIESQARAEVEGWTNIRLIREPDETSSMSSNYAGSCPECSKLEVKP
jgi:hypothetical protein